MSGVKLKKFVAAHWQCTDNENFHYQSHKNLKTGFSTSQCNCSLPTALADTDTTFFQRHSLFNLFYVFYIYLCKTLRLSVFNKKLLTYTRLRWTNVKQNMMKLKDVTHFFDFMKLPEVKLMNSLNGTCSILELLRPLQGKGMTTALITFRYAWRSAKKITTGDHQVRCIQRAQLHNFLSMSRA